jgi:hypothetical protein
MHNSRIADGEGHRREFCIYAMHSARREHGRSANREPCRFATAAAASATD